MKLARRWRFQISQKSRPLPCSTMISSYKKFYNEKSTSKQRSKIKMPLGQVSRVLFELAQLRVLWYGSNCTGPHEIMDPRARRVISPRWTIFWLGQWGTLAQTDSLKIVESIATHSMCSGRIIRSHLPSVFHLMFGWKVICLSFILW